MFVIVREWAERVQAQGELPLLVRRLAMQHAHGRAATRAAADSRAVLRFRGVRCGPWPSGRQAQPYGPARAR
ncbi:hypothetical protein, partial [Thiocapsa sp.]|uniref:hypothetical protein n=1 Tax=Thiocapsa sp. TaxID=2024551 RepID=UPI0025D30282